MYERELRWVGMRLPTITVSSYDIIRSPGSLHDERDPAGARQDAHAPHSHAAIRALDVLFDRHRYPREHEATVMPDARRERGCHLDQLGGEDVRQHQRPRPRDFRRPASH